MQRPKNFRLITLGRLALVSPDGVDESVALRRRKLTLLAVLALSDRPYSRDALTDMFWGEEDEERARHSLSDALSHFRRLLGRGAIGHRRADVELSGDVRLAVDAREFAAACETRDFARAIELYEGPLLDGVHVDRSPRFDEWLTRERDRYERLFLRACEGECLALARARRWEECAALARRWLAVAPLSTDAALYLINSVKAPGTRESALAAIAEFEGLRARLAREHSARADHRVAALATELAERVRQEEVAPAASRPEDEPRGARRVESRVEALEEPATAPAPTNVSAARKRTLIALAAAALSLALITGGTFLAGRRTAAASRPASSDVPVVAITLIQNVRGDSSVAWLEEGLKQMIAADLSRSGNVTVVAPSRVREALRRRAATRSGEVGSEDALRVAREVGATWAVSGGLTRGEELYVLDVALRDASTGALVRLFTVTNPDILDVAEQAASHILATATASGAGPRLADVETGSVTAYQHYVRSVQAHGEGRFADESRELDAAIAIDSGFVSALTARFRLAREARDSALVGRLASAMGRARGRATDWDRLSEGVYTAHHNGERTRAVALGRQLVERFPRDPRAYAMLADIHASHGKLETADSVLSRALALDSLASETGLGPCVPCTALGGIVRTRLAMGEVAAAERAADRWVALQPEVPAPWSNLSEVLAYAGRYDSALTVARRASALSGGDANYASYVGRVLLMSRRFDQLDSAIAGWLARDDDEYREMALDLQSMLLRERGELRASNRVIEEMVHRYPSARALELVRANGLARLGEWREGVAIYEREAHSTQPGERPSPFPELDGDRARTFAWHHALAADAMAEHGDTLRLRILADSIEMIGARSYYARDWRLYHHVRGILAERSGRLRDAVREYEAARWGIAGWTVTVARLANVHLELGEPLEAIELLRGAYKSPPDAMGRYEPRSELDLLMARAFAAAGMRDSSETYAGYVRAAWAGADPEVKMRLTLLNGR